MLNNPNSNQVPNLAKKSSATRQSLIERPQEIAENNLISLPPLFSDLSATEKPVRDPSNTEKLVSDPSNTEKLVSGPSNTENNLSTPVVTNERASESLATVEVN